MPKYLDPSKPCACTSGKPFGECCRPYLRGEKEAPDAVALMRSRYSGFATENAAYLLRTLHQSVPERARPETETITLLRRACRAYDYPGVDILDSKTEGDKAQVLFLAHMFDKGRDDSFIERSDFVHEGGKWFYTSGEMQAAKELENPLALKLATFVPPKQEEEKAKSS
jgi:SEC-C motif-containing protein